VSDWFGVGAANQRPQPLRSPASSMGTVDLNGGIKVVD
ncbi:hypothetical protein CRG98_049282, partial [Punica granatum]